MAELSISGVPSPASLSALAALYRVGPFGTAGALGVTLGECTGIAKAQISAFRDCEAEVAPIVDRLLGLSLPLRPNTAITSAKARILWRFCPASAGGSDRRISRVRRGRC